MRPSRPGLVVCCLGALTAGCARKQKPPPPPPVVVVARPLQSTVVDWDDFVGQFEAIGNVQVRPRVSGYVIRGPFRDGQIVRKGQMLFEIDPRPFQAALDQAKGAEVHAAAALADAKVELKRSAALLAAHATTGQDYDTRVATERQAEGDLETAQGNVRTAELNLLWTKVVAPITGRVSDNRATNGNLVVQDSTVLTTIVSQDPIRFTFQAPESLFLKYKRSNLIREGGEPPAQIRLQDDLTWRWKGRLQFVDNSLDTSSGTIRAWAIVDNRDYYLTPGMFGHMRMRGTTPYTGLLIPDQSVTTNQSIQVVFVVEPNNVVTQRAVHLGPMVDGLRVVRDGLKPDDRVVIDGMIKAKPGHKVTPRTGLIEPRPLAPEGQALTPPATSATFEIQPR